LDHIEILDDELTSNCDLADVKSSAKKRAISKGGNCIYVYEYVPPDHSSPCHRISGKVYRIDNPREYETEIVWSASRKLEIRDFKGTTKKRPFMAETHAGFNYTIVPIRFSRKYIVKTRVVFNCNLSYFKPSNASHFTLKHEQLHFDLIEIYRRSFERSN